jgi:hypothetical protein
VIRVELVSMPVFLFSRREVIAQTCKLSVNCACAWTPGRLDAH